MDKTTKKGLFILLAVLAVMIVLIGGDSWYKKQNRFVYEESLEKTALTVDGREITLRELGYYVYTVEMQIDKQARLYNAADPLDYWNTRFNNGVEGGYISEMARDIVFETCVCDLIYEEMAMEQGFELSQEQIAESKAKAEDLFRGMSDRQKEITGLTLEMVEQVVIRKALVSYFASEYFDKVSFDGYSGYREELVSYSGAYYKEKILPLHQVKYDTRIYNEMKMGRISTEYNVE